MSNKLEQFIRDNREEFDSEEPRPQLWKKLQENLEPKKDERVIHLSFLRYTAAAAILILVAGMFFYMNQQRNGNYAGIEPQTQGPDTVLSEVNPTYAKELYHFTQLIELKQNELKQIEKEHPELYVQFVKDIQKLDSSYQALRADLPANPGQEKLLEAMIQNLRLQADLLNQQLNIIKQIKQTKQNSHEKDTRSA
ncbi:MAG TPA: hypothetical protein VD996_08180 [Chitinophagaceae bacterium]|nr:hypothetical protein [Chitinophagaceae bacterium]